MNNRYLITGKEASEIKIKKWLAIKEQLPTTTFKAELIEERPKAIWIIYSNKAIWLPKSQCTKLTIKKTERI